MAKPLRRSLAQTIIIGTGINTIRMMRHLYILSVLTLLLWSCGKTNPDSGEDIDNSGETVFSADYENVKLLGQIEWKQGETIGVFGSIQGDNERYVMEKTGAGSNTAVFYGPLVKGDVIAYHPFDEYCEMRDGRISFWLDANQEYNPSNDAKGQFLSYCPTAFAVYGSDKILHFQYPLGILSVQVDFNPGVLIKQMSISTTRGISGKLSVDYACNVVPSEVAYKSISLEFGDKPVSTVSDGKLTEFFFVLPSATFEAGDIALCIVSEEETMNLSLPKIEIERVSANDFHVTSLKIGAGLDSFKGKEGYLE